MQATDRLVMIQSIGRLELQLITAVSWSVSVMIYSPYLVVDCRRAASVPG